MPIHRLAVISILALALGFAAPAGAQQKNPRFRLFRAGMPPKAAEVTGLGTLRCFKSMKLGFADRGVLAKVLVEEGDQVKKGQVLARLDDRVLRAEIRAKAAELDNARREAAHQKGLAANQKRLYQSRAISRMEYQDAVHNLNQARGKVRQLGAELGGLKAKLAATELRAPLAGTVIERQAEPGEVTAPGESAVLVLMSCSRVLAEVAFGEKLYSLLQKGQPVLITADAVRRLDFVGRVYSKSPKVDDKDRTFKVKVLLKNPGGVLRPGMFVRATLLAGGGGRPLWIPLAALTNVSGDKAMVRRAGAKSVEQVPVVLGQRQRGMVQALKGLEPGDLIVVPRPQAKPQTPPQPQAKP